MASKGPITGRKTDKKGKTESNMLTCGVCMERYRSPKLLPCFHTFCQRCVEKVAGTKPSFPCPTCRTVTVMPPGGAAQLQANFYLEKDLASLESETGRGCDLCNEGKQAQHKCVQCQQVYCTSCRETHDAIQSCTLHTVLPLTADSTDKEPTRDEKRCPKHKNQPLLLFCCQCEVSICMQCKLTSHDGHETEDVVDTGEKARAQLTKELQSLTQKRQVLEAVLAKTQDFQEDLKKEKEAAEKEISARTKEIKKMVDQAQKESMESVLVTLETAVNELKEQSIPLKMRNAAIVAKQHHIRQVVNRGDDDEAVAMLAQMKAEAEQARSSKSSKTREDVTVERGTVSHQFKSRAVKYTDVLAFIGMAREGPVLEMKALSLDATSLQESVKPRPNQSDSAQLAFRKHRVSKGGESSFTEVIYSKNPKSTLTAMHLTSDDGIWLNFNPGGNVPLLALFDDDGRRIEVRSENFPTSGLLVTIDDNTTVCMTSGQWVRSGVESGTLDNFSGYSGYASKSSPPFLLQSSSVYRFTSLGFPPQIDPNPIYSVNVSTTSFDVSADGNYFACGYGNYVYVLDKIQSSTSLRRYSDYPEPSGYAVDDVCFCFIDGEEMMLVAYSALNTVHVVDHKDGCCFVRKLETDQCPLQTPYRLTTNHQGRVWVGCNGGKVVIFDV